MVLLNRQPQEMLLKQKKTLINLLNKIKTMYLKYTQDALKSNDYYQYMNDSHDCRGECFLTISACITPQDPSNAITLHLMEMNDMKNPGYSGASITLTEKE